MISPAVLTCDKSRGRESKHSALLQVAGARSGEGDAVYGAESQVQSSAYPFKIKVGSELIAK